MKNDEGMICPPPSRTRREGRVEAFAAYSRKWGHSSAPRREGAQQDRRARAGLLGAGASEAGE